MVAAKCAASAGFGGRVRMPGMSWYGIMGLYPGGLLTDIVDIGGRTTRMGKCCRNSSGFKC